MNKLVTYSAVGLMALASAACPAKKKNGTTPPQVGPSPEQAAATLRQAQAQTTTFLAELEAAVREQPRDETWATAKEQQLRQSYAESASVPKEALRGIECRRSRCVLQFEVRPEAPQDLQAPSQALAIDQWIAWSQPCGYTLTHEPGTEQAPGTLRVFLDCDS